MAGTPYLVDSNILLRWVKPDHNDYPLVVSAIDAILRGNDVLCYTSQNVGEFWNTCTRPLDRNGYALSPQETDRRAKHFEEKLRLLPDSLAVFKVIEVRRKGEGAVFIRGDNLRITLRCIFDRDMRIR